MPLFDGAIAKKLFDLALTYIQAHPELIQKLMDMLFAKLFPEVTPVFGADEELPAEVQAFGAECDEVISAAA